MTKSKVQCDRWIVSEYPWNLMELFSGLYTRWSSFCPKQRKISLIKTLTHRALMIFSKSKLDSEPEKLTKIILENGYPEEVISVYIKEKKGNFSADVKFGPQKCPVYLKLPWIGNKLLLQIVSLQQTHVLSTVRKKPFCPFKRTAFLPHKKIPLLMNLCASVILAT